MKAESDPSTDAGRVVPSKTADDPSAALATAGPSNSTLTAAHSARSALVLAFATIYLIWGSTYLGIRIAIESMPGFLMAGTRFLIAGVLLFTFLRFRGASWPNARQWRANAVIGIFLLLGGNGLVVWAEQTVPTGVTALLIGVQPLFFVLTEWAWPGGSRPSLVTTGALLLGFAGVAWLAAPWENAAHGGLHLPGVIAILGACIFWAFGSIYSRYAKHGAEPFLASSLQMLCGGAALAIAAVFHGDFGQFHFTDVSLRSWAAFLYLIVFGSLVAFSTFAWLMKHSTPAHVATYAYVNPVVAVFLGWLILHEPVTTRTIIASAVIVAAVVIITMEKNKAPTRATK